MSDASAAPTYNQVEAARRAGWDPGQPGDPDYPKAPPSGWASHALPPAIDPELGNNGVPAPVPGDPDHPDREQRQVDARAAEDVEEVDEP